MVANQSLGLENHVRNSIAAGRRLATRIVLAQAAVSLVLGTVFFVQGWQHSVGIYAGGCVVMLGNALLAARMFASPTQSAGLAMFGFVVGTAMKWIVMVGGIYALIGVWQLPAGAVIAGLTAALLVNLMALRFKD